MTSYKAFRIHRDNAQHSAGIEELELQAPDQGEILIRVHYSSINYKDALAGTGKAQILRRYPLTGGIDACGEVAESSDKRFKAGDSVIVTGYELSATVDGGYAEYLRVPAEWAVPLPEGLSASQAMTLGTAGFTAALALHRMEMNGQRPDMGPVLVTGATGGVGCLAVNIFDGEGFDVHAVTGKSDQHAYLEHLGAQEVLQREQVSTYHHALERGLWGGAVDNVGGEMLSSITRKIRPWGNIAAIGLAGGHELNTTVMPFILRGVSLLGVDSAGCPYGIREEIWQRLANDLKPRHLDDILSQTVSMEQLPEVFDQMLAGQIMGRTLVTL
ncbi:MAG: oxidoreductase [gamma proteobacterium symbiont of Ctena orbiculata]|nr:oxidoreductase [Candidatus Thiodiazotropha taylori]PUB86632.1 MAG: oxidoreductase [gamma proteobacterium symbiont of Ctena orbiculata]MBT2995747.1 oxidoreductase [Candidatus Thiodiazotropha taylori]MBT2999062.1 oxidoreductase [Candidatus Thiodiazotropha taylori]MBT3026170.1 oxidoreductase [Candidatus Thiodiazotropha taylori]